MQFQLHYSGGIMLRVIDVETTGMSPADSYVIEIASIDLTKDGIVNPMQTFVSLPEGVSVPANISAITHIIDDDIQGAPAFHEAIERFKGADFLVSHNSSFDSQFIPFGPWICTYKCALRAWPDLEIHSNQGLRYALGLVAPFGIPREDIKPHRADSDVIVTAAIFHALLKKGVTFAQMKAWTAEPAHFPRLTFGKHRGTKWNDVPTDYLDWMANKAELEPDWKAAAQRELEARKVKAHA